MLKFIQFVDPMAVGHVVSVAWLHRQQLQFLLLQVGFDSKLFHRNHAEQGIFTSGKLQALKHPDATEE